MSANRFMRHFQVDMKWVPAEKERILPDAYYLCKTNLDERGEKPWCICLGTTVTWLLRNGSRPAGCPVYVARITDPEAIGASDVIALKHNVQNQARVRGPRQYNKRCVLETTSDNRGDE